MKKQLLKASIDGTYRVIFDDQKKINPYRITKNGRKVIDYADFKSCFVHLGACAEREHEREHEQEHEAEHAQPAVRIVEHVKTIAHPYKNICNVSNTFWANIPDDCKTALSELNRLKVATCCAWDQEETFYDVWWLVLHEVDMYADGEFCREASRSNLGIGEPNAMNLAQAKKADAWLIRWEELANKYCDNGEGVAYGGQL